MQQLILSKSHEATGCGRTADMADEKVMKEERGGVILASFFRKVFFQMLFWFPEQVGNKDNETIAL